MKERDYSQMTPEELNSEFLEILDLLPSDFPAGYYTGNTEQLTKELVQRRDRDLTFKLRGMLDEVLAHAEITKSFRDYILFSYDNLAIYGINNQDGRKFLQLTKKIKSRKQGIFSKNSNLDFEELAMKHLFASIEDIKSDINTGRAKDPSVAVTLSIHKVMLSMWKSEFKQKYHREPFLPNEV